MCLLILRYRIPRRIALSRFFLAQGGLANRCHTRLVLLHREDQLLKHVSKELIIFSPRHLRLLQPRVNTEQPCLVQLLWLNKRIDPIILPFLQQLHLLLTCIELLLVLAEIGRTNIFDLIKFLIILDLQSLSV